MYSRNQNILNSSNKHLYMTIEFLEKKIMEASTPEDFKLLLKRIDAIRNFIK